jgi:hypothetical protein
LNTVVVHPEKPFTLRTEINKSGDTSDVYTDENNDWAGQPSLVYEAEISKTEPGTVYALRLAGHGGMIGEKPGIYKDLAGFDTALRQIEEIRVSF